MVQLIHGLQARKSLPSQRTRFTKLKETYPGKLFFYTCILSNFMCVLEKIYEFLARQVQEVCSTNNVWKIAYVFWWKTTSPNQNFFKWTLNNWYVYCFAIFLNSYFLNYMNEFFQHPSVPEFKLSYIFILILFKAFFTQCLKFFKYNIN